MKKKATIQNTELTKVFPWDSERYMWLMIANC